jgi:hypothetical protein
MSALAFPASPSVHDIYTSAGRSWKWTGTRWAVIAQPISPSRLTAEGAEIGDVLSFDGESYSPFPFGPAITVIENRQRQVRARLYHDNAAVFADGRPGTEDPSSLVRPGWHFTNSTASQKINWYFWSIAQPGIPGIPASQFSPYALITLDTLGSAPFVTFYSAPTGTNDAAPGFYHSAWVYQLPTATRNALTPSQKVLLYAQHDPVCHPGLAHHALTYVPAASHGERGANETIAFAALHSDSGATTGTVQWLVEALGVDHSSLRLEIELAIRPALVTRGVPTPPASGTHTLKTIEGILTWVADT